jgi:hypothetical protein
LGNPNLKIRNLKCSKVCWDLCKYSKIKKKTCEIWNTSSFEGLIIDQRGLRVIANLVVLKVGSEEFLGDPQDIFMESTKPFSY